MGTSDITHLEYRKIKMSHCISHIFGENYIQKLLIVLKYLFQGLQILVCVVQISSTFFAVDNHSWLRISSSQVFPITAIENETIFNVQMKPLKKKRFFFETFVFFIKIQTRELFIFIKSCIFYVASNLQYKTSRSQSLQFTIVLLVYLYNVVICFFPGQTVNVRIIAKNKRVASMYQYAAILNDFKA